jgi:hypothetical protein
MQSWATSLLSIGLTGIWPVVALGRRGMPCWFDGGIGRNPQNNNAFRISLGDPDFSSDKTSVEYRWADDQLDRLPALAASVP